MDHTGMTRFLLAVAPCTAAEMRAAARTLQGRPDVSFEDVARAVGRQVEKREKPLDGGRPCLTLDDLVEAGIAASQTSR